MRSYDHALLANVSLPALQATHQYIDTDSKDAFLLFLGSARNGPACLPADLPGYCNKPDRNLTCDVIYMYMHLFTITI